MQAWQTALLTASLSVLTAIITTKVTAWSSHRNEVKKWLLEKRSKIYLSFYNQVELALKDRKKVFEQEYLESLIALKPQMKLLSSKRTFKRFHIYLDFIQSKISEFESFCYENAPECDKTYISQIEIDLLEWEEETYKQNNSPSIDTMNFYIEPLYQAMRKDLGSNF